MSDQEGEYDQEQDFDMEGEGQYLDEDELQDNQGYEENQLEENEEPEGLLANQDQEEIGHHHDVFDQDKLSHYSFDESFEKDVDIFSKAKANLLFLINEHRTSLNLPLFNQDISLNMAAADFSIDLKNNQYNSKQLKDILDLSRIDQPVQLAYIVSNYDEQIQITRQVSLDYFIEIGYLFYQMEVYKKYLEDPSLNHIGIGLAGNQKHIVIVYFLAYRSLSIISISFQPQNNNRVQIKGKMLETSVGVYCVRAISGLVPPDLKNHLAIAYPSKISYSKVTKQFIAVLELANPFKDRKFVQIYTRVNPDTIGYGKQNDSRPDFKSLQMKLRANLIEFPDQRVKQTLRQLYQSKEQKIENIQEIIKEQIRNELIEESKEEDLPVDDQPAEQDKESQHPQNKENAVTNKEIREELQSAIADAKRQKANLKAINDQYVTRIKQLRIKLPDMTVERSGQMAMNQHKYLNTLTQVHQTRLDLKNTHQKYLKMYSDLQQRLNEKKLKCDQIRKAFTQLKKQVAKKAAYSRTDKPIPQELIQRWQNDMNSLNSELQKLRLNILKFRNTYTKNQKILKKKEELADGLHLIDFEQLKIQNQTLNERIEERNQELNKLKKKTTTMVQILTHNREKYNYICKQNQVKQNNLKALESDSIKLKQDLRQQKRKIEKQRLDFKTAKQQTEIINSQELVLDYRKRQERIVALQQQIQKLQQKQTEMSEVIQAYKRKMKKDSFQR